MSFELKNLRQLKKMFMEKLKSAENANNNYWRQIEWGAWGAEQMTCLLKMKEFLFELLSQELHHSLYSLICYYFLVLVFYVGNRCNGFLFLILFHYVLDISTWVVLQILEEIDHKSIVLHRFILVFGFALWYQRGLNGVDRSKCLCFLLCWGWKTLSSPLLKIIVVLLPLTIVSSF